MARTTRPTDLVVLLLCGGFLCAQISPEATRDSDEPSGNLATQKTSDTDLTNPDRVSEQTYVLHSTDQGKSWRKQVFVPGEFYMDIHFTPSMVGWIVGGDGCIYKSGDRGRTWSKQGSPTMLHLYRIHFIDSDYGWVIGDKGTILRTTDGGQTWSVHRIRELERPYDVHFRDRKNGWVTGSSHDGHAYETTDGGMSWKSRGAELGSLVKNWQASEVTFRNVRFVSESVGFMAVHVDPKKEAGFPPKGLVLKTENGGRTWNCRIATEDLGLSSAFFLSANEWWVVPVYGEEILRTRDGGQRFESLPVLPGNSSTVSTVYFTDSMNGWLLGVTSGFPWRYGVFHTSDGGKTWVERPLPKD